jgi:cell division protein FtsQ
MSERDTDPAALDELSRAFGVDPPGEFEGVRIVPRGASTPAGRRRGPTDAAPDDEPTDDDRNDELELEPTAPTPIQRGDVPTVATGAPTPSPSDAPPTVISIGGDDDLPDPVYVEGNLDAAGRRGGAGRHGGPVVVIEDDESGDVLKTETARDLRRGVEPRMRERRDAVRKARLRKRLTWVGVAITAVLLVVAGLAVLGSGLFAVEHDDVRITGNVYADPERLEQIVDDLVGTPTLLADTQEVEHQIEEIPWVADAKVTVRFPHSASIEIRERKALTTYQGPDHQFRVLDREGRVLDVLADYPIAYVLIDGPDPVNLSAGQFAPFGYVAASELAMSLTPSVRGRVVAIDVTADGASLAMILDDGVEVHFGEARDLLDKLVRLETVLSEIARAQQAAADGGEPAPEVPTVIDVSTRETTR